MNILDHSRFSRGSYRSCSISALVGYCYLNNPCCMVKQLWGKFLGLQHLRNGIVNCDIVRSGYACFLQELHRNELLIDLMVDSTGHTETSPFFGIQLKDDLSRAQVDWERASSFTNAVLFTLRSSSRSSSSS